MSGHSKFHNIKATKDKADAKRSSIFTKIGREIQVAVKMGGPDPTTNSKLADVIAKAKSNNMPNDNIQRSIKKASGETNAENYDEIIYEGYGPGGVAFIVECLTDNKNRTAGDVRHAFDKHNGNLGTSGSVMFMFERKGVFVIERQPNMDEDEVMMSALDAGADDVVTEDDAFVIYSAPNDFHQVRENLEKTGYSFVTNEVEFVPSNYIIPEESQMASLEKLIDALESLDDVQNVYHNADI